MRRKRELRWRKLDNVAKIFPATAAKTNTGVLRFFCELKETVDPERLQRAVDLTMKEFPAYLCELKKGAFWFYLEESELRPKVFKECKPVCAAIYGEDRKCLLFEVTWFKSRITVEMCHLMTDGTGAMHFLRTIVYYYLKDAYAEEFDDMPMLDFDATIVEKESDAFSKYYDKRKGNNKPNLHCAYNMNFKKREDGTLQAMDLIVSVQEVLEAAHRYHTTMTVYLTAIFCEAIHKEMSLREERRPIVLNVPVNLRKYFPSETIRNFFGLIGISYDFGKESGEFEDILQKVDAAFRENLTKEKLAVRMNSMAALEHNIGAKIAPLPLKNVVLKLARKISEWGETAVISNVGKITMPKQMEPYISMFGCYVSTLKLQICMCSFQDKLQIGFTSAFESTNIQKHFARMLTSHGIQVEVRCSDYFREEGREHAALPKM